MGSGLSGGWRYLCNGDGIARTRTRPSSPTREGSSPSLLFPVPLSHTPLSPRHPSTASLLTGRDISPHTRGHSIHPRPRPTLNPPHHRSPQPRPPPRSRSKMQTQAIPSCASTLLSTPSPRVVSLDINSILSTTRIRGTAPRLCTRCAAPCATRSRPLRDARAVRWLCAVRASTLLARYL